MGQSLNRLAKITDEPCTVKSTEQLPYDEEGIAVRGYVRMNFKRKCMIKEIVQIIIRFYEIDAGSVYLFGNNINYFTMKPDGKCITSKRLSPLVDPPINFHNFADIDVHHSHALVMESLGNVYYLEKLQPPRLIRCAPKAIPIAIGSGHSMILAKSGTVFTFGAGIYGCCTYGQLGHGDDILKLSAPKCVESIRQHHMVQISAATYNSFAMSDKGEIFLWGKNNLGQCGVGINDQRDRISLPALAKLQSDDSQSFMAAVIECGNDQSFAIANNGLIFSWGSSLNEAMGDLGHGRIGHNVYSPKVIEALRYHQIVTVSTAACHTLCINQDGVVFSWGNGERGRLGHGNRSSQSFPKAIQYFLDEGIKAKWCSAGSYTSCIITEDDRLYSFGVVWGNKYNSSYLEPTEVKIANGLSIGKVVCGDQRMIMITGSRRRTFQPSKSSNGVIKEHSE